MKVGILGTGNIASQMADTISRMKGIRLYACASRTEKKAEGFAEKFGFEKAYGSYEDLLQDPQVDLVYIATPNNAHYENVMQCLKYKKAVLCEKPFAMNYEEAETMIRMAEENNVFLAEAMWMRYQPLAQKVVELVEKGAIGVPRLLIASKGELDVPGIDGLDPAFGGSALMGMGVYAINNAFLVFVNRVKQIKTQAIFLDNGVDGANSMILKYEDGKMAMLCSSLIAPTGNKWYVCGDDGMLEIQGLSRLKHIVRYNRNRQPIEEFFDENMDTGYEYEVQACFQAIKNGKLECPEMPHSETLAVLKLMDQIKQEWLQDHNLSES